LQTDQSYREQVTTRAAQAIWDLIETLVLKAESDKLFTIRLANVLSVEIIDPDPLAAFTS
jgi:hypothetical protein